MIKHLEATAIHAIPAEEIANGFRLLVMREFQSNAAPSAFAMIEQHLLRSPQRQNRHGLSFACAFRPEIVAWLSDYLGRPSSRDGEGRLMRNPRWPVLQWRWEDCCWPDGVATIEWFAEVVFRDEPCWRAFRQCWSRRLAGTIEGEGDPVSTIAPGAGSL